MAAFVKSNSLTKNMVPLTKLAPRPIITWDKYERITRNKEIWDDPKSIVHRLPKHYQELIDFWGGWVISVSYYLWTNEWYKKIYYWKNFVLADRTPVHYRPPKARFYWDIKRNIQLEAEEYPVVPEYCPEQDQGLWGGEGVVKGYYESRPYTKKKILPRRWIPKLWFPAIKYQLLYSEVLDKHMKIIVTERVMRLIDKHYGLDFYLLQTPEININSKTGWNIKRAILISLAKEDYYPNEPELREYIKEKYKKYVFPLEQVEWMGLDLNTACRKLQDIEDNIAPIPLKHIFEKKIREEMELEDDTETEVKSTQPIERKKWMKFIF